MGTAERLPFTLCLCNNQYCGIAFTNHVAALSHYKGLNVLLYQHLADYFDSNKIDLLYECYFISFEKIIMFDNGNNRISNTSLVTIVNIDDIVDLSLVTTNDVIDGNLTLFKLNLNMKQQISSGSSNEYSKCFFTTNDSNYCIPAICNGDLGGLVFNSPMDYIRMFVLYLSSAKANSSCKKGIKNNGNNLAFPQLHEDGSEAIYVPFNRLFFPNNNVENIFKIVKKSSLYFLSIDKSELSNNKNAFVFYCKELPHRNENNDTISETLLNDTVVSPIALETLKDRVNKAKQILLDTNNLIGRKKEYYDIYNTLFNNIRCNRNSSLYIYGNPGLGKSVVVQKVVHSLSVTLNTNDRIYDSNSSSNSNSSSSSFENMNKVKIVKLNGNSITIPTVYHEIYTEYMGYNIHNDNNYDEDINTTSASVFHSMTDVIRKINLFRKSRLFKSQNKGSKSCGYGALLLVIDEIDRSPAIFIKDIFSVTATNSDASNSVTVLSLCIANSICIDDITMSMQYNTSNIGIKVGSKIVSFDAYTESNFVDILKEKLCGLAEPAAITYIAKKCCKSGDVRELLQIASVSLTTAMNAVALTALINSNGNKDNGDTSITALKPIITLKHVLQCLNNLGMGNDNRKKYTLKQISSSLRSLLVALLLYNSSQSNNITIKEMFAIYSSFCLDKGLAEVNKDMLISYAEQLVDYSILVPSEGSRGRGIGTTGKKRKGSYLNDSYNDQVFIVRLTLLSLVLMPSICIFAPILCRRKGTFSILALRTC